MIQIKTIKTWTRDTDEHDKRVNEWLRKEQGIIPQEITHSQYINNSGIPGFVTSINYKDLRKK